jgi:hypothetical protein
VAWSHLNALVPLISSSRGATAVSTSAPQSVAANKTNGTEPGLSSDAIGPLEGQQDGIGPLAAAADVDGILATELCLALLRLLVNLIGHSKGGASAFKVMGVVELMQSGPDLMPVREHPELGPLVAACLAAVAYAPTAGSCAAAVAASSSVGSGWMSGLMLHELSTVQHLQWILCAIIGVMLVGMLFLSDE